MYENYGTLWNFLAIKCVPILARVRTTDKHSLTELVLKCFTTKISEY